jgi:hypothetical protein
MAIFCFDTGLLTCPVVPHCRIFRRIGSIISIPHGVAMGYDDTGRWPVRSYRIAEFAEKLV